MGYKRKPPTSLLDLIEGQPGKSQQKLPPPPPKTQSVQTRSTSTQQKLPPPPPPPSQTSLPSGSVPTDPKKKKDKGKRLMEDKLVPSQEEDNALWPFKQIKIGSKSQDRQVVTTSSEAQAVQATYRLEAATNDQGKALDLERERRFQATRTLKTSEADLAKARDELKAMTRARDSTESGLADFQARVAAADGAQREAEWAKDEAQRAKVEAEFGREEALALKEEAETTAYAEGVAEIEALYKGQVPGAAPDGAEAGEVVEEVGAVELREDPGEEAPQGVAEVPSDAQIPTTEEAAILAVSLQAVPLGQGSEDPEVAPVQPFTGGEIEQKE
nr:uncharacterized protein LOC112004344 [Quercus suber]